MDGRLDCVGPVAPSSAAADDEFTLLVAKAPNDSNLLTLVNAESIRRSKFYEAAQKAEGEDPIPGLQSVNKYVAAARWRLPEGPAVYETMIIHLDGVSSEQVLAKLDAGTADRMSENRMPEGMTPVSLAADTLGLYYPNDRQAAQRWAKNFNVSTLSDYLTMGVGYAENNGTQIVFAVDMDDALDPANLKTWFESNPFPGANQLQPQGAANAVASLKGCTMGIRFTDRAVASWRFDFGAGASIFTPVAKPLMLNLVGRLGLSLNSMQSWKVNSEGNSLFMKGELDAAEVRILLSVLAQAPEALDRMNLSDVPSESQTVTMSKSEMSKTNYDSLKKILRDITHPTHSILTSGAKAQYLERYARKIDELPILNVDENLVEACAEIATRLRVQSERLRGNQITAGTYSNNSGSQGMTGSYASNYGGYGAVGISRQYGLTDQQVAKNLGRAKSAKSGAEQKKEIMNLMADLRRTLTERYQIEF